MQTTSFQGTSPKFAGRPTPQPNVQNAQPGAQTPALAPAKDSVRFGGPEKSKETSDDQKSKDPNFLQKTWRGVKQGFSDAFTMKEMGKDILWGSAAAVASFIIPPHAHALVMVPLVMLTLGLLRFGKGVWHGFRGDTAG